MSAFGGKADMTICACLLSWSLSGAKRTCLAAVRKSGNDPKRTWVRADISGNKADISFDGSRTVFARGIVLRQGTGGGAVICLNEKGSNAMASKLDSVAKWAVVAIKRHPFAAANVRSVIRIMKCVGLTLLLFGCWTSPTIAIVGDATPGNPFADSYHVVLIEDSHGDGCTGVALARNIVLTAAHCVIHVDHKYQIAKVDVTPVSIPVVTDQITSPI